MKASTAHSTLQTAAFKAYIRTHLTVILWLSLSVVAMLGLLLYRLGSITPGLSSLEIANSHVQYGWHSLLTQPLDLPLNAVRALVFALANQHAAFIDRLPNACFGLLSVIALALLLKAWHGTRIAVLATILFACSSWVLHISRLASNDVLYVWSVPLLLVLQLYMHRHATKAIVWYGSVILCGLLLYIPGLIWFVALSLYWQRSAIRHGWTRFGRWWQRSLYLGAGVVWLPLLVWHFFSPGFFINWLGLPPHLSISQIGRQLAFVPIHLFVRGPLDTQRWLGHAPLLDLFSLVITLAGIWFYVIHWQATRSRLLGSYALVGLLLVGFGGAVGLSVLVPLLYIFAAMGMAYLLRDWLQVFPLNPIARRLGIGLMVTAVAVSCIYNMRAYFVAWAHNSTTLTTFRQQNS